MTCTPRETSSTSPSASTTSWNDSALRSPLSLRSRRAVSAAMTWRRRARRKSASASARGEPVSRIIVVLPRGASSNIGISNIRDLEHAVGDHVADRRVADPPVGPRLAVGVDVAVQVPARMQPLQQGVQRVDADVRAVVLVAEAARRCVREQDVDRPGLPPLQPPDPTQEAGGAPVELALAVLVGTGPVADAPAEADDPQPGGVDDRAVGAAAACRARRLAGHPRTQELPGPVLPGGGDGGIVVAGDEHDRAVGHRGEELEIVPGQVAGREHDVRRERGDLGAPERVAHLVGDGEHADHAGTIEDISTPGPCLRRPAGVEMPNRAEPGIRDRRSGRARRSPDPRTARSPA